MLIDQYNRTHTYLRISLTDNCNFRCTYCMPDEKEIFTPSASLMQADEISAIAQTFVGLGVDKIRLTGGEPFVRKDIDDIITSLAALPVELVFTTNASRLHKHTVALTAANIQTVNISLDSLNAETFHHITKRNEFAQVWENIQLMLEMGMKVKINVVVMKGVNDGEINDFIAWTKNTPVHVRFIEFMPFTGNHWQSDKVITWSEIAANIERRYDFIELSVDEHATEKLYIVPGHAGTFSVISTMSAPFCSTCNRMRLTSDGKMKNCLFSKGETDILSALRAGGDIVPLIKACIYDKAKERGGQFGRNINDVQPQEIVNRSMIAIGG